MSAFYFEIQNELVDSYEEYEIRDKYIIDLLDSFASSKMEQEARELSKKYILEQGYDN